MANGEYRGLNNYTDYKKGFRRVRAPNVLVVLAVLTQVLLTISAGHAL